MGNLTQKSPTSIITRLTTHRGVAQSGSVPVLGTGGRRFKSYHPDHVYLHHTHHRCRL
jgi:hypothetical protein